MKKNTQPISWIKAAEKEFRTFPTYVQERFLLLLKLLLREGNLILQNP